ncbi:hypothetical protein FFI89_002110 [Bradyrhizobium sp. KBS0727]|nr:hypothetical protein FFI71_002110 [Bradyrhizobium sp. KBS0725]QDW42636.1 hypothetical protein FFI89_002110 [Bradyrhizobium sp. KBS0727]
MTGSRTRSSPSRRADLLVIASEAKQSIFPRKERMDCFVASLPCANASRLLQAMTEPRNRAPTSSHRRHPPRSPRAWPAPDDSAWSAASGRSQRSSSAA